MMLKQTFSYSLNIGWMVSNSIRINSSGGNYLLQEKERSCLLLLFSVLLLFVFFVGAVLYIIILNLIKLLAKTVNSK